MKKIKNIIYRHNVWLDRYELAKFTLALTLVAFPSICMMFSNNNKNMIYTSLLGWFFVGISCYFRVIFINDDLKFNKDIYIVPKIGDSIEIENEIKLKSITKSTQREIDKGIVKKQLATIHDIQYTNGDWVIYIKADVIIGQESVIFPKNNTTQMLIVTTYFHSRKFWKTKQQKRDLTLSKIGI